MMLHYAVGLLLGALIAAVLAFSGLVAEASGIGKTLFVVFVLAAVATLLLHRSRVEAPHHDAKKS
jgi:uncharacterized membrane protein YtjA (UPF0391 family)